MKNHNRKAMLAIVAIALVCALLIPAAVYALADSDPLTLEYAGSTTVGPIITAGLGDYNTESPGGTTIIDIRQVGSSAGINELKADTCDLAMSSRELKSTEAAWADEYPIARDAVCIIVSDEVPSEVDRITKAQIEGIYEGTITNWQTIAPTAESTPIIPRARITDSGTRATLLELCSIDSALELATITTPRLTANVDMQNAINNTTDAAVGYVGLGFSEGANLRELPVVNPGDGIAYYPSEIAVYSWRYPLARYLYLIMHDTDPGTTPNPVVDNFAAKTASINWWQQLDDIGQDYTVLQGFLRLVPDADVTGDGHNINVSDRTTVGNFMGLSGDPHWVRADVNRSGNVNVTDRATVGNWMGTSLDKP